MESTESIKAAVISINNSINVLALETVRLSDILNVAKHAEAKHDPRYDAALAVIRAFESLLSQLAPNVWQMAIASTKRCNDDVNEQIKAAAFLPEAQQEAAIETIFVNLHGRSDAHKAELRATFEQANGAAQVKAEKKPVENPLAAIGKLISEQITGDIPKPKHPAEKEFLKSVDELVKGLKGQTTKEAVIKEAKAAFEANDAPFKRCQLMTVLTEEARDAKELSEDNYATIMAILMRTIILGSINELKKD